MDEIKHGHGQDRSSSTRPGRRLAFVTQWFAPEKPVVPLGISEAMARAGWSVHVLTGIPNYPTGRVHAGYKAWRATRETLNGVPVRRTPLFPSHDRSAVRRIGNYVSWALSASLFGQHVLRSSDVSLVYSSPATAALPALLAKVGFGKPYVLLIQDLWPDSVFASGFLSSGLVRRIAEPLTSAFVNATYRHASHVAVSSPGMRAILVQRGVPVDKISVVFNWVDETALGHPAADHSWRQELGIERDDFVLMYAGNHGVVQGLDSAIETFGLLPPSSRAHLVLVGEGVEKPRLVERARRVAPGRVHFLPWQPADTIGAVLAAATAHLISLKDDPLFRITMPSKTQASLALGKPVLIAAPGDAGRVAESAGAGLAVAPEDPDAMARAVLALEAMSEQELRRLGENGRRYYLSEMAEPVGARRLSRALLDAVRENDLSRIGGAE